VPLFTTPAEYPVWRTLKPILVPRGAEHTYEYVVFNGDKIQRWEGQTRTVNAVTEEVVMEDEFGLSHDEQDQQSSMFATRGRAFSSTNSMTNATGSNGDLASEEGGSGSERDLEGMAAAEAAAEAAAVVERFKQEAEALKHDSTLAGIMQGRSLVLACFHLPVELKRNPSTGGWTAQWNDSLIARSDQSIASEVKTVWVGTINAGRERVLREQDKIQIRKALAPMHCVPVFADNDLVDKAYLGYCKQHLWPSFHNVDMLDLTNACWNVEAAEESPELSWDLSAVQGHWEAYAELNATFALEVNKLVNDPENSPNGSVLWVHDYHLMLLPSLVADAEKSASKAAGPTGGPVQKTKICFFLHIPFSTSQIFRSLQHGHELLRGMLASDVVGFHAFDHARHFLVACKRNLGLKFQTRSGGMLGVEYEGRTVSVVMRHVSIDASKINRKMLECNAPEEARKLKAKHEGRRLIAGLDTCQRLSGVALKLLGFERLLDEFDKWRDKAVLVQRCFKPRNRHDDEDRTSRELHLLVERINEKYPGSVDYEEVEGSRLTSGLRLGLWLACDVLLNTSVREGLNLNCFEYVYVKDEFDPGVIVASEFSTTVSVLNGAMRINPFDIKSWKSTLDEALSLPAHDRAARKKRDIEYVASRPASLWTRQILNDMMMADEAEKSEQSVIFTDDATTAGTVFNTGTSFSKLEPALVSEAFEATQRRVFIFDYGGTLMFSEAVGKYIKDDINPCHKGRKLPDSTVRALHLLSQDPRNAVYIISSLAREALQEAVSDLPLVGLAAQNGLCYCLAADSASRSRGVAHPRSDSFGVLPDMDEVPTPAIAASSSPSSSSSSSASPMPLSSSPRTAAFPLQSSDQTGNNKSSSVMLSERQEASAGRKWFVPDFGVDWDEIKAIALPILNRYTGRTNGATIRFRQPTVAWSYYRCDPEWGIMQAGQLATELEAALSPFNVQVQHEGGEVQIVPKYMHKGTFVKRVLQISTDANTGLPPDFIFVVGDDTSDEKMFSSVLSYVSAQAATPSASTDFQIAARQRISSGTENDVDGGGAVSAAEGGVLESPSKDLGVGGGFGLDDEDGDDPLSAAVAVALEEVASPLMPFGKTSGGGVRFGEGAAGRVETRVFTCTVGKKPSEAGCYVEDVKGVGDLLEEITKDLR
jgi:trehalose 6-phosphate synthase/phosphatase